MRPPKRMRAGTINWYFLLFGPRWLIKKLLNELLFKTLNVEQKIQHFGCRSHRPVNKYNVW